MICRKNPTIIFLDRSGSLQNPPRLGSGSVFLIFLHCREIFSQNLSLDILIVYSYKKACKIDPDDPDVRLILLIFDTTLFLFGPRKYRDG